MFQTCKLPHSVQRKLLSDNVNPLTLRTHMPVYTGLRVTGQRIFRLLPMMHHQVVLSYDAYAHNLLDD
jgi:hypothetical protein